MNIGFSLLSSFNRQLFGCLLLACLAPTVQADADDTFNIYLAEGIQQDSNLFRQSANEQSDSIQSTSATLAFAKSLAQQRFSLDASLIDYRYSKNDYLDYRATNYNGAWNWALTHRLTGVLSLSQTEAQTSFVDYSQGTPLTHPIVRRTNVNHFGAEWQVMGGWRLLGGVTNNQQANSSTFTAQNSYELNTWEAGAKYIWPAGNYLQLLRREGNGTYKDRVYVGLDVVPAPFNSQFDTGFSQTETEARLYVPLTGKSAIDGKLAHQSRQHDHFSQRDYSVNIGRVDYTWLPTGNLSVVSGLRREVAAYQTIISSYYLTDGFKVQPSWQISPKVILRLSYDWQRRKYEGALITGQPEWRDKLQSARVGVDWAPVRWATLSTAYQRDTRHSTRDNFDFNANIFSVTARLNF